MKKDPAYFEELIARYFCGEASPAEISELSAWVAGSAENKMIFRESQYAWMAIEESRLVDTVDLDKEWASFEKRLGIHEKGSEVLLHKSKFVNRYSIFNFPPSSNHLSISRFLLRLAAVMLILASPAYLLYRYLHQPAIKELSAISGRIDTLLPDGSRLTLNTGAKIKYPEKFKGKNRAVSLEGEAYFDVAHNASQPFIIAAGGVRVEVKGTSFYINTHSWSGDFELVLTTGKVELYFENDSGPARVLNPGEKAVIHGNRIIISPNEDANYMAWKTHRISFNNEPLNSVAATLSKVYQSSVCLGNPALAQCRITATFDNQSLESVLNVIKATLDVDIRNSGSLVEISGKGCR
jgi:ferric-dicitrate binding protein FerR (iron transport regulator)